MILSLGIRDFVLIERIDLDFAAGLSVLTGETGAGKSILVDSLALVLGERGDSASVRLGAAQATVIAEFDIAKNDAVIALLTKHDIPIGETLILRRVVTSDGRSRAAINDQSVSVALLREVGGYLTEILGQFEGHGLLNAASHRGIVDRFGGHMPVVTHCRDRYKSWQLAANTLNEAKASLARAARDEAELRQSVESLTSLNPKPNEEAGLLERRARLMQRDRYLAALAATEGEIVGDSAAEGKIARALRHLEKLASDASPYQELRDAIARAASELDDAIAQLDRLSNDQDMADGGLELLEDRLHSLRSLARKLEVLPDQLPEQLQKLNQELLRLDSGNGDLKQLEAVAVAAKSDYFAAVKSLSLARREAAAKLDLAINMELKPLKLERAIFATRLTPLVEADWGAEGAESVAFEVATNAGTMAGPLHKIASGGELSRFMLALELVLAKVKSIDSLVFDEVDSGVGGATADAIGERLARLAMSHQLLTVTHSPQVAARGQHHWRVEKQLIDGKTVTQITPLTPPQRIEEIARMLSGAEVTREARAAAAKLLGVSLAGEDSTNPTNLTNPINQAGVAANG